MDYIKRETANTWNDRLDALMKRDGYTQETFLKAFKKKYGTGTQTNVSRWRRVGHTISDTGKEIGFPSYENMKRIADFFGVSIGYLTGETDYETFEMERTCTFLGIDEETGKAVKGVASGESIEHFGRHMSKYYSATFGYLMTAPSFPKFMNALRDLAQCLHEQKHPVDHQSFAVLKIKPELLDLAYQCIDYTVAYDEEYGEYDEFKENGVEPTPELLEAIQILFEAREKDMFEPEQLELKVKLAKYELQEIYFDLLKEITADSHLDRMAIRHQTAEEYAAIMKSLERKQ